MMSHKLIFLVASDFAIASCVHEVSCHVLLRVDYLREINVSVISCVQRITVTSVKIYQMLTLVSMWTISFIFISQLSLTCMLNYNVTVSNWHEFTRKCIFICFYMPIVVISFFTFISKYLHESEFRIVSYGSRYLLNLNVTWTWMARSFLNDK